MEVARFAEQANGAEALPTGRRSLRKKKSLKQLLIPSRQKSLKSPPLSSSHVLPNILSPAEPPLPYNARALSTTPAKTFSVMFNERLPDRTVDQEILQATETLWGPEQDAGEEKVKRSRAHTTHDANISTKWSRSSTAAKQDLASSQQPTFDPAGSPASEAPLSISLKPIQRSFTEGAHQATAITTTKPTLSIKRLSTNHHGLSSPRAPSYAYAPRSPDISIPSRSSHINSANRESFKEKEVLLPDHCQRIPWNPVTDMRQSVISGQSTGSSYVDSASTKHSSVFTKDSAVTETTIDAECADNPRRSMTVDEAIDMYIAGFKDDDILDLKETRNADAEEITRRSAQIAEAMDESIAAKIESTPVDTATSPTSPTQAASHRKVSEEILKNKFHRQPPLQAPTATHDQYGFRKASRDITVEAFDAWFSQYSPIQERRTGKWLNLLQAQSLATNSPVRFPAPSAKVQRFVRKGIPPAWRGEAWFFYAGGYDFLGKQPDHYSDMVSKCQTSALSAKDREAIERDLHRTFPENIHFKPLSGNTSPDGNAPSPIETPILSALRRLLSAFAVDHPAIGYCQSLNFIAGLLLLFLSEEKAFWMLHIITTRLLPGSHEESLEGTDVDTWVLMLALKAQSPGLWSKIGGDVQSNARYLPDISMCTTSWFMSAFIGNLPIEGVLRIWDIWFYEGSKTLFRIALAIFRAGEEEIKKIQDPMETLQVIQTLPRKMLDIAPLFELAFSRGEVGKKWIEKKRQERKEYHIQRRAAERARRQSSDIVLRDSDTKSLKGVPSPPMIEEEPLPWIQSASTKSRF